MNKLLVNVVRNCRFLKEANQFLSLKKILLFAVFVFFLIFIFGCKISHIDSSCNIHLILTSQLSSKENFLIDSIFLLSLIAISTLLLLERNQNFSFINLSLSLFFIFFWFWQFIFKIFNPILVALSQGTIHPKIYNFNTILA